MSLFRLVNDPTPTTTPGERCELCSAPIAAEHSHLVDVKERRLLCACRPCYLLFAPRGAAQGRYKCVPDRYEAIAGFGLDDGQWEALQIPIGLAFFFFNSTSKSTVAFYPGPAGATESLLPLGAWDEIVAAQPTLAKIEPDVEAALVHRPRDGRQECFIVPIDVCYELVGMIRMSWKGFDGGEDAHRRMSEFFSELRAKSRRQSAGAAP